MRHLITGALAALTLAGGTAATSAEAQAQTHYDRQVQAQSGQAYGQGSGFDRGEANANSWGRDAGDSNRFGNSYGQGRSDVRYGQDRGDYRYGQARFGRGQVLPQAYRGRDRFVDYRRHDLRAPPRGYGWVQGNSNQFVMVALATGLIAAIANH